MTELIVDQSDWGAIALTGDDRVRFLQGMCSGDVETLAEGAWLRAVTLNPKGRVTAVIEVCKEPERVLVVCEPVLTDKVLGLVDKYAIMDDVEAEAIDTPLHRVWGAPSTVWDAPPILAPPPGRVASPEEVEVRRVEAGLPRYGIDVSEEYFPFESELARYLDYEKGCYIGQEPIYRVYAKGQPNKRMLGLRIHEKAGPVAAGAQVSHPSREAAGVVTSSVVSPDFGSIALAYIHRSVADPGVEVVVAGLRASLVALPFDSSGEAA